jgi:hypothetical protein
MSDWGAISPKDLNLFHYADTPKEGFEILKEHLTRYHLEPQQQQRPRRRTNGKDEGPEIAKTLP